MEVPLTAEIHREGEWFVAFCPEVPEANGQGRTQEECLASLRAAILLLMQDRRLDAQNRLKEQAVLRDLV
jgi:predicted RNase H-like HicB family nuclease